MRYFIRFGEIPENERSGIYHISEKIGEEIGVSVFDATCIDDEWRIVLPLNITEPLIIDLQNFGIYSRPIKYLVTGDVVGKGTIGEPLIRNVKVIKNLGKNDYKEKS